MVQTTNIRISRRISYLFLVMCMHLFVDANAQKYSNFTCENKEQEINFVQTCDGVLDCGDGSDEKQCENEAVLFYYTYEKKCERICDEAEDCIDSGIETLNLTGVYLNSEKEFTIAVRLKNPLHTVLSIKCLAIGNYFQIVSNGPQLDVFHKRLEMDNTALLAMEAWLRISRTGHVEEGLFTKEPIREVVSDWVMGNVYYIPYPRKNGAFGARINICHSSLEICIPLRSKFNKDPLRLTIAPERRLLFWIELNSAKFKYNLYKYTLDVTPKTISIHQGDMFALPRITIDPTRDLIYWMQSHPSSSNIIVSSITFEGADLKAQAYQIDRHGEENLFKPNKCLVIDTHNALFWEEGGGIEERDQRYFKRPFPNTFVIDSNYTFKKVIELPDTNHLNPSGPLTFVVFDNIIYWMDFDHHNIRKCPVNGCSNSTIYRQISTPSNSSSNTTLTTMGYLTIDHHSSLLNKTGQDICSNSSCSHLCLLNSDVVYDCYCEFSERPLPSYPARRNGYCEGTTLIATYGNHLYVVGLSHNIDGKPIIRKNAINISSISTVTYNPITGNVILTEMGRQNIYTWVPRTGELELILEEGPGTISSIEVDPRSNNLYWVDPTNLAIKVMNLVTRSKITLMNGNSTYYPTKLSLNLANGYMFVLFVRSGKYIPGTTVERISMNGDLTSREFLVEDTETGSSRNHSLHYMNEMQWLCSFDGDLNEIVYMNITDKNSGFRYLAEGKTDKIERITSLNNTIVWSEGDLKIYRKYARPISLGLERRKNAVLGITPVVNWPANGVPMSAECLQNNGGCEELCLVSDRRTKFTCACTEGRVLINRTHCRNISEQLNTHQHLEKTDQSTQDHSTSTLILVFIATVASLFGSILGYMIARKSVTLQNCWHDLRHGNLQFSNTRTRSRLGVSPYEDDEL